MDILKSDETINPTSKLNHNVYYPETYHLFGQVTKLRVPYFLLKELEQKNNYKQSVI